MSDFNWRDYVSFDVPQHVVDRIAPLNFSKEDVQLSPEKQALVEKVLDELSQTPEGRELIRNAAAGSPDGQLYIFDNLDGHSAALGPKSFFRANAFGIGDADSGFQYMGKDGNLHDITLQRLIVHELHHFSEGQKAGNTIDFEKESDAIHKTNLFMQKYYGSVPRDEDSSLGRFGNPKPWDLETQFKIPSNKPPTLGPKDALDRIETIPAYEIEGLSIETQSLWEVRANPEAFVKQYTTLVHEEGIAQVSQDIAAIDFRNNGQAIGDRLPAKQLSSTLNETDVL